MNGLNTSNVSEARAESNGRPPIFDQLAVLADPLRCRLLLVLTRDELTVAELSSILQLPQSTTSRHLKVLSEDGWLTSRRDGTSRRYVAELERQPEESRRLWELVREQVGATASAQQDERRLTQTLAQRRTKSQEFFSSAAGEWARLREEMFGRRFDLHALLGLLDPQWVVGDLGVGTGQVAVHLAPNVQRVIAVDESEAMLEAARRLLVDTANVDLRRGDLENLPIADGELDAATILLTLHHLSYPAEALQEASRVLRPGGRLLIVDMLPHDRQEYRQQMGHLWLGFSSEQIHAWLTDAGFGTIRIHPLPTDSEAKGPSLFAASAGRLRRKSQRLPEPQVQPIHVV